MQLGLILGTVISQAQLDRRTTLYTLEKWKDLQIQKAAGPGFRRRFTATECIRIAVCTRLVMHGVPLDRAVGVTKWAEAYWRGLDRRRKLLVPFQGLGGPWRFCLINGRYVQLWQDRQRTSRENDLSRDDDDFFDTEDHLWLKRWDLPDHLPELSWDMRSLGIVLSSEHGDDLQK